MDKDTQTLGITVAKADDLSEWYTQVVLKAEIADYSAVKGCIIMRPHGFALWEKIQKYFNKRIAKIGVQNAYFPLFIPETFFQKEAQHAEGFAPEVAWIANTDEGVRLAVRPTSETIMCDSFSKWVRSHRDLPLRVNQWVNVVRWETKATRIFLRGREFLWQEGHCLYADKKHGEEETRLMLDEYVRLCEKLLALPVLSGKKVPSETFAGADYSLTIEAIMPDGKALQSGTSHFLGQGFMKAFDVTFLNADGGKSHPYHTSWGISTRLLGALIMTHGDDKGLVFPPGIAPLQVAVVPILFDKTKEKTLDAARVLEKELQQKWRVVLDDREEYHAGFKFNEWELKGVPFRIEIGPKDIEKNQVMIVRRDTREKHAVPREEVLTFLKLEAERMHQDLYTKAQAVMESRIVKPENAQDFIAALQEHKVAYVPHCGEQACEDAIKEKTSATPRCIPFRSGKPEGTCVHCEQKAKYFVYYSKQY